MKLFILSLAFLVMVSCTKEEPVIPTSHYHDDGIVCYYEESPVEMRGEVSTDVLIIESATDAGTSALSADGAEEMLRYSVEPFWDQYINVDYTSVVDKIFWTAEGIPPTISWQAADWIENNILFPALEKMGKTTQDYGYMFVLLPPGTYGFEGYHTARRVFVNTQGIPDRWDMILKHELGHAAPFYLNHSRRQLYDSCIYQGIAEYGGDDVMGGQAPRPLNPHHLNKLGVLNAVDVTFYSSRDSVYVWLNPVESKYAVRYGKNNYIYYRQETDEVVVVNGTLLRKRMDPIPGNAWITPDYYRIEVVGSTSAIPMALGKGYVLIKVKPVIPQC